ncbi:protein ELYS-like [Haliotis asinina]|uniref:protein ELYS-like n=1 Tax=Haliotis asinina TaxID=109174 RepID=UPI003531A528
MRNLLTPSNVSTLQSFQPGTQNALEKVEVAGIHASISKNGKATWLYHGPSLEVISTNTRDRLASWQFGAVLKDAGTFITSVKELSYEGRLKLVVGLHTFSGQGMVCLLDVSTSQVVKAVELPYQVTSVETVLSYGGDGVPEWAISEQMRCFYGIVAVGTQGGYVYLIDMNLDDEEETSDEVSPSSLFFITPRCRNVKDTRKEALSRSQHLCLVLDENSHCKGEFCFRRPDDSIVKDYRTDSISITCLKYIPQDGNLAVGFSFGGFQLWKLYAPVMEYSSRLEAEPTAVSHILYQEPENDPKNFCYIWVGRDNSVVNVGQESISTISLYQLSYGKKTFYANYGVFFEELHSVCLRIEHNLAADPYSSSTKSTWMSQIVSCYTLTNPLYTPPSLLHENESFEESSHGPDLSLCVFVWEVQDNSPGDKSLYHLGIFDMNRWYHAQMPTSIRIRESTMDLCSFFAVYQLGELCDLANPDALLHLEVKPDSLKRYINNSPLTPEQHFYPTALAFDAVCVFETGTISAQFLGRQRQVLYDMEAKGPSCLLQPQDVYNICLCTGLLPRDLTAHTTPAAQQRQALLNMALDHSMIKFINCCITAWAAGEFVQQGCTLKFLLDWAWDKVAATKHNIDSVCAPLYDWSGNHVDHRLLQVLNKSKVTLHHLRTIILTLLTQSAPTTEQGVVELETRLNVIQFLSQHLQIVLWFIDAGLLPECDEIGDDVEGLYRFPAGNLTQAFSSRRAEIQKLHSEISPSELLLIDGLVDCCGDTVHDLWEREGGSGLYPPPSLHALLNIYLLEDVSIGVKHSIVLYLLLDLASLVEEHRHEQFADKIAKFAKSFSLPLSVVKQIQAFWLLDHKDFEEAFLHLLHPMSNLQLGQWQQCRVIKSLLFQGESKLALRYISLRSVTVMSQEEVKLKLTVLLANGLITEAFEYQRACRDKNNMADLLSHLFLGCHQTHTIDQLLQLPLSDVEEHHLQNYLLESSEPHSAELLVMHYLQRARYIEAIRLNEKIKHRVMTETSAKARERAGARNSIVDGFFRTLPAPQKKLVGDHPSMPRKTAGKRIDVRRPKPLSTVVTQSERSKVVSHSSLILAMMEKVQEVKQYQESPQREEEEKESDLGPFLCTPITPRKKLRLSEVQDVVYPTRMCGSASDKQNLSVYQVTRDPAVLNSPLSVNKSLKETLQSKKKSRYSVAGTMSLLQTPKVRRKSPSRISMPSTLRTPQSILKVRRLITKSPSPASSTLDVSDKTPTALHRPKRLGFAVKLSAGVAAKLKQPTSVPTTPKQLSFADQPSTSGRQSTSASVSSTPKHLRFVEPVTIDDDQTPVKKKLSPPSPPSPRSVKNRSPTPESLSPKMAARMDSLIRPPIRTDRQRGADDIVDPPDDDLDDDITFNFNPADSDEMEIDDDAPTPPDLSPSVPASGKDQQGSEPCFQAEPGLHQDVDVVQEQQNEEEHANEDDVVDLTEDDNMEAGPQVVIETRPVAAEPCVVRETRADSTEDVGVDEDELDLVEGEIRMEEEHAGEADVTSTQVDDGEDFCPDTSGEIEIRASPARSTRSSPARSLRESPARSLRESPARSLRESPARSLRESPARSLRESPARSLRESPARSLRESPARSLRESPARSLRESPARSTRSSPARSLRESPARTLRESPARSLRASPTRSLGESQERSQQSPALVSRESSQPSSPGVSSEQTQEARSRSPRKDSPRRREQSWLKMESPVKVFDELFAESPGKSTRSATKKITDGVSAVTVTEVSTSRTSRDTLQLSPSRKSKKAEIALEEGSPVRLKSASPSRRASRQAAKHSPTGRKSQKENEISPVRSMDDEVDARATSASPSRRASKAAAKASPGRRKSKKEDLLDASPERASSTSPARQSPRRKSVKDKVEASSPPREGSASPSRRSSRSAARRSPARGGRGLQEEKESPERTLEPPAPSPGRRSSGKKPTLPKSPGRKGKMTNVEEVVQESQNTPEETEEVAVLKSPSRSTRSRGGSVDKTDSLVGVEPSGRSTWSRESVEKTKELAVVESLGRSTRSRGGSVEKTEELAVVESSSRSTRSRGVSVEKTEELALVESSSRSTRSRGGSVEKTVKASGGRMRKQMTQLKEVEETQEEAMQPLFINTDLSDSEVGPVSPIRRSPRLMMKTLSKQLTDSEGEAEAEVLHFDSESSKRRSTRRTAAPKQKEESTVFKTPPRASRVSAPLTPPESGKDSPDKAEETKSRRKSPARKSVASARHSTRIRAKDVTMETQEPVADKSEAVSAAADTSTSSFLFSEPMSLEPELQERLREPGTPVKNFIFSPPIQRKRSAPVVKEDPPTPVTSLLPPPTEADGGAGPSRKPKTRKAVKKETSKKKKIAEPPHSSPSDSPINFVSPAPQRRVTRAMQDREASTSGSTSTAAVTATFKRKTRKKVSRLN